ncbi:MAG: redoxin domain-containing protein, partial [Thermomicrobiales bacterium]
FCKRMEDDLKSWEANKPANAPELLIVSTGSAEDNRAHGFQSRILLDSGFNTGRTFGASGTPSAVMVGADGSLKSGVAVGAPSVLGLLRNELPDPAPARGGGGNDGGEPAGIKVGAAAPSVELKDLDGDTVKLTDFRGSPTALLFWNPGCGFCKRMEDDLKAWERNKPAGAPKLLIVSTGDAASNRAHGFDSTIVLDSGFNTGRAFGASGTPSAVLVGADGSVQSSVAVGAPGVLGLLRGEAVAVEPSEPAAPSIGDQAPVVRLPDLNGGMVDLADNLGSRSLVLFWNPGCGFCKRMLDELKAWESNPQPGAPKLLVVSTGSAEDNRAMGMKSPVVLDGNFSVGNAFGSNGTPSAILIDANGRVASALAVGGPNVMELARSVD